MTEVVGAVETIVNGASSLRKIVGDLRAVVGDHTLLSQAESVISDIEAAVHSLPEEATTVEKVAEGVWGKIVTGFDDLFHPHKSDIITATQKSAEIVSTAVDTHTAAVADAVTQAVQSGTGIATGPTGSRVVGGTTAGAPASSQPASGTKTPTDPQDDTQVDTGKLVNVTDDQGNVTQQKVMDSPKGPSSAIKIG